MRTATVSGATVANHQRQPLKTLYLIVGRGRLGRTLTAALVKLKRNAGLVPSRSWDSQLDRQVRPREQLLVIIAVPDPANAALVSAMSGVLWPPETAFIHLSGALGLSALTPLAANGYAVGSFHPLQSFPKPLTLAAFKNCLIAIDATTEALRQQLITLALDLGGAPRWVTDSERPLYHAAAVMASNYPVALAAQACLVLEAAGWTRAEALAGILPVMQSVIKNIGRFGLNEALIGPLRRGDSTTVGRHLAALDRIDTTGASGGATSNLTLDVYRILGRATIEIAAESGLEIDKAEDLRELLSLGRLSTT